MLIDPKIIKIESKNLIGMSVITTPSDQEATGQLWKSFMPHKDKIKNVSNDNLYSVQIFPKHTNFKDFNAETPFQKWAAVEVNEIESIPEGMKALNLPKGEYAIFIHHGPSRNFPKTAQYIFGMWLPNSIYEFDHRPQFEIMGSDYKGHDDEDSQEEVWIPIKRKPKY